MTRKLARLINITEPRFGFSDYRKPIVWFDQTLVVSGNLAAIAGRVLALVWTVAFVVRPSGEPPSCALLAAALGSTSAERGTAA